LAARRSLLFFFDRDYAYILAEATRTISLMNDDLHDVDDALWLGNTIIPRGLAVCEHTMNIPGELGTPTQSQHKADEILIINDLKENNNFCDRPFVTDGPKARFYAGVPITTPAGIRIGVYCILDDHPREGLNDAEVTFMHEMADTVMSHLELLRIHTEFRRQNRMLQGLNSFVKDGPTSGPGPPKSPPRPVIDELADNPNSASDEDIAIASSPPNSPNKQRGTSNRFSALAHTEVHDYASEGEEEPAERRSLGQAQRRLSKQMNRDSGGGARNILQRASDVLREAIDADGVVFLDASTQVVNGTSSCPNSGTDTATTDGSDDTLRHTQDNDCRTLGRSHRSISPGNLPMPENLLKRLLAKHPLGKIWIFNSDGEVSSTEEGTSDTLAGAENSESSQGRRHRRGKKSHEAYEIRRLFPEARAVCLVGMWDSVRQRWFAGSLLWSYSASRIFSAQGEIAYAMAFCDVVFANVARRESKMNARAKTDFISSLSHELRSPLHGIIGSMELLQERNTLDHTLISQMEKCTTVLTDVVEQLLDFAKIESRVKSNRRQRGLKQRQPSLDSVLGISSMEDPGQTLARLTEEVADAIFYSHCCKVGRQASSKVDFVLDISAQADLYINGATGSWKRICGNIIGNALKFTTAGHVSISLKALVRKRKQPVAVLSVSDTGCGMSQEFVATELFRPFAQEDMLTVGAGLGLSVVAKLVKALGGKVEVQTNKGSGTTITVALPLNSSSLVEKRTPPGNSPPLIGLLETDGDFSEDEDAVSARRLHLAGIESACRHRGAQLTCSEQAQVNLIFEDDLDRLLDQGHLKRHADGAHIVILCRSLLSAFQLQNANHTFANAGHVEYLCQPYGPERLGSAIFNCLQADTSQHTSPQTCTLRGIPQRNVALLPRPNASYEGSLYLDDMMARKAMNDSTPPDLKDKGLQLLVTEVSLTPNVEVLSPNPAWPKDPRKLSLLLVDDNVRTTHSTLVSNH
jgi:signal transduction histidine kinase